MTDKTIAYHFTNGATLRDGRPVPPIGETLVHDGPIDWCKSGLYASIRPCWALSLAPGNMLHQAACEAIERQDAAKLVCRRRTIRASIDATTLLLRFAADQALSVAHLWEMPDSVRDYLTTLDETARRESFKGFQRWPPKPISSAAEIASVAAAGVVRSAAYLAANNTAIQAAECLSISASGHIGNWKTPHAQAMIDFDDRVAAAFARP